MTKREELDLFMERAQDLINAKFIVAEVKIAGLLKSIAASDTLLALFKNCLKDFDYEKAKKTYLVKNKYLPGDKGEFVLPSNARDLLAFIFTVLFEIDSQKITLGEFINKYFFEDGSYSSGYSAFVTAMIKPFKNSVKMLMESVMDGKLQDPVEAFIEQEKISEEQRAEEEKAQRKEKDLMKKSYGASVRKIKSALLDNKQKINDSKLKVVVKNDLLLIVSMLANAIDSEDKDAITYAFVAYKYACKAHKLLLRKGKRVVVKEVKSVLNGI